jgi:MFS transporter, DHA3 family, macrolide efflux protein
MTPSRPGLLSTAGGRTFVTMWVGQSISSLGSRLTVFAFGVWLYQQTGEATPLFLTALFGFLPGVLLAPVAGVLVDRYDRRTVMLLINTVHTLVALTQFALLSSGAFQLWMLYALLAIASAAETFQWPAESSSMSVLVPKEHIGRANGLYAMMGGAGDLIAPIAGAALVSSIGITGIILLDLASFAFEFITLFIIRIPRPAQSEIGATMQGQGVLEQARDGFRFILERPGLLSLLITFTGVNFLNSLTGPLQAPLVLSRTGDPNAFGIIAAAFGAGVLLGGAYMTTTGGPKPRVAGVLIGIGISGFLGQVFFGLARDVPMWMLANFIAGFLLPVLNGSSQAIWQTKTPGDVQGRVFAARRMIAQITSPMAFLIAGPLADDVFKPLFTGEFGNQFAWLLGDATGRGYAAMWVLFGALSGLWGFAGYLRPAARNVERDIPDAVNASSTA